MEIKGYMIKPNRNLNILYVTYFVRKPKPIGKQTTSNLLDEQLSKPKYFRHSGQLMSNIRVLEL